MIGETVSHYRISGLLGRGGMGDVYVADDELLHRKVAVKAIRKDRRFDEWSRARFLREARTLSQLDHPNICRVYDYVQHEEADFIVLELLRGRTLGDELKSGIDRARKLWIAEAIADVLVAAHAEGIIHRDLKPDNVMITEKDEIKVLDFGIARSIHTGAEGDAPPPKDAGFAALDRANAADGAAPDETTVDYPVEAGACESTEGLTGDETGETRAAGASAPITELGTIIGTPRFMSPEQALGRELTPASDLYSFGLLLQNLFTGQTPYESGPDAPPLMQQVRAAKTRPVVGIDKDLAALIERLKLPAPAARPTAIESAERLRFIRGKPRRRLRNLAIAAVATILVLAGVKYTLDVRAERARALAAQERATVSRGQAEELINFMLGDLHAKLAQVGRLDILDEASNKALAYYESLPEADLEPGDLSRRSTALSQIGDVRLAEGKLEEARSAFAEALAVAQEIVARDPNNPKWRMALGRAHSAMGFFAWDQGDLDAALEDFEVVRDVTEKLLAEDPSNEEWLTETAYAHNNVGFVKQRRGDLDGALDEFLRVLEIKRTLAEANPADLERRLDLAHTYNSVGRALESQGNLDEALEYLRSDLEIKRALLGADAANTGWQMHFAVSNNLIGNIYQARGDLEESARSFQQAVATLTRLANIDPANTAWRYNLAVNLRRSALVRLSNAEAAEALVPIRAQQKIIRELLAIDDSSGKWQRELGRGQCTLARALAETGMADRALREAQAGLVVFEDLLGANPGDRSTSASKAECLNFVGSLFRRQGRAGDARASWREAVELLGPLARDSGDRRLLDPLASALIHLDELAEARPLVEDLRAAGYREPEFVALCASRGL